MRVETITLNEKRGVTLTALIQDVGGEFCFDKRPAMIVLPGGAYAFCSAREADPVAIAYAGAGYQTFILRYTLRSVAHWPCPMEDYEAAYDLICERAEEWHVRTDKIAVVGFSAGGHLAACAATMSSRRPAAAILVYAAVLKDIVDYCQDELPYPIEHITPEACPCFLVTARNDTTVNVQNTLRFCIGLEENGIPFESHVYSFGDHGFSLGNERITARPVPDRLPEWVEYSVRWLRETLGAPTRSGFRDPDPVAVAESRKGVRKK